jgi:uracil-DNA glycosylase
MVLIGQAPGAITDRLGFHFAGPSGKLLDLWFQRAGYAPEQWREVTHITSLTRCFPGKAKGGKGDRAPSRLEIALCRPYLLDELAAVDPHLVILVGKMAIDELLGKMPLTESVGRIFEKEGRRYLPLPHASGVSRWLNEPANRALVDQALQLLADERLARQAEATS